MRIKLKEIAEVCGAEIFGAPEFEITNLAPLEEATENDLSFLADKKYLELAKSKRIGAIFVFEHIPEIPTNQLVVSDPRLAFFMIASRFVSEREQLASGISPLAFIDKSAYVAKSASIGAFAYIAEGAVIGDGTKIYPFVYVGPRAKIGSDCTIFPHVAVGADCIIGNRVRLHFGVKIGADGFGYVEVDNQHQKIPQVGTVVIEDDVEIGANSCVDRATMGKTIVGCGTKIDNLVQIGHNCKIGKNCILVAHAGLGGSTILGDNVIVAARAGTKDHIKVGDRSMLGAMAGVGHDLPSGSKVIGYPAEDHMSWKRKLVYLSKLGELFERVKELEKKVAELKGEDKK